MIGLGTLVQAETQQKIDGIVDSIKARATRLYARARSLRFLDEMYNKLETGYETIPIEESISCDYTDGSHVRVENIRVRKPQKELRGALLVSEWKRLADISHAFNGILYEPLDRVHVAIESYHLSLVGDVHRVDDDGKNVAYPLHNAVLVERYPCESVPDGFIYTSHRNHEQFRKNTGDISETLVGEWQLGDVQLFCKRDEELGERIRMLAFKHLDNLFK